MKKALLFLASAALLLVGCAKEKFSPEAGDAEMVNMTVTASVQGEELTKAAVDNDGMGVHADRCIMVLYYGDQVYGRYQAAVSGYHATFDVKVPAKRTYKAVFWADCAAEDGGDLYYNTADLKNITLKGAYVGNNDKRDAFFCCAEYKVENKVQNFTAELTRPFAQINVISKDIKDLHLVELYPQKVNLSFSAATSFNAMSGECGDAEAITYEADVYKAFDSTKEHLTLSMDYLFASTEQGAVDIEFKAPTEGELKVEYSFTNIPYRRNYRTNIVGNLLTADAHWDVTIEPKWGLSDDQKIDVNLDEVDNIEAANIALAAGSNDLEIKLPSDSDTKSIVFTAVNDEQDVILNFTGNLGSSKTIKFDNAEDAQGPMTLNVTAPAGTKLVFNDPQNHVVINGTSYELVQGAFSANTLVISENVNVSTLKITAGGLEIHGTVVTIGEGLTNSVKVRACEGLSNAVYTALKNYIEAPYYKAVKNGEKWDIVAADKTAMIGENVYYNIEDALNAAQSGDEIKLLIDLENIGTKSLKEGVTFNGCGHQITGESSLYINANGGAIKNVAFKNLHNSQNKQSAIYATPLNAKAEISDCTFENIDWDAIQITTNSANADIVIKDNEFKAVAKDTKQQRFIHIQTDNYSNVDLKAAITGNKFSGIYNLQNTAIELYCPTDFNKVNISGNYLDGNKVSVCIANRDGSAWVNHIESAKNWLDANGQPVAVNAAISPDKAAENILLCTTLAVALQESSNWTGSLCIMNEAALRELSTLVNGGNDFSSKTVALVNDIDLKNVEWTPIGQLDGSKSFAGIFDGHNNTVSNLTVTGELEQVGFFGYTSSGSVKNLKLKNISLQGSHFIGAVVAYDGNNSGLIENCYVDGGSIVSTPILINGSYDNGDKVGGIAGQLYGGHSIKNCSVKNLSITAYRDLGGIIGHPNGNCTVDGNVVEKVTLIQSSKNAYKDEVITTIGEIAGRDPQYAEGQNTVTNVSIITQPVEGYTFYKNEKRHEISSVAGLKYFRDEVNKGNTYDGHTVQLMNSLNLSGETWKPIGGLVSYPSVSFYGVFDGQGYTISNLSCNETLQNHACAGLFGSLMGTVKNVILTNVVITSTHYAGGICAYSSSSESKVENCKVIGGTITSTPEWLGSEYDNGDKVGGIFGYNGEGGPITGCSVENLTIRAYRDLGGVVGAGKGTISACTVKNTTIIQDNTNGYKTGIDTYHEILGRDLGATLTDNSFQNVTLKSEN